MKVQFGISLLLFSQGGDAFHLLHSKRSAFIIPNDGAILQPRTSRLHVSVNPDEFDESSRQRLKKGLKRLLRKPSGASNKDIAESGAPVALKDDSSIMTMDQFEEEVAASAAMSSSEKTLVAPAVMTSVEEPASDNNKLRGMIASWRKPKMQEGNMAMAAEVAAPSIRKKNAVLPVLQDERNNKILHILALMAGTLWWYAFSSYEFLTHPQTFDVFGIYASGNEWIYNGMSAYVTISQLCTYFFLWKLMTTTSLREGQAWIGLCIVACVPADTIVILFDPTGSKGLTVLAFTLVTLIYGVLLAFYLREAAVLEPNPTNADYQEGEAHGMWQEVIHYRPPGDLQNTHMALDFARSFGAFTVTVAALRDQIFIGEAPMAYYITLLVVVAHSALEMVLTTVTPGLDLHNFRAWIKFQTGMSMFQMFAAIYIAHLAPDEDMTIWDDLVYSCLFGSAAAALQEYASMWGEGVDFDTKLGMANSDISNNNDYAEKHQYQGNGMS